MNGNGTGNHNIALAGRVQRLEAQLQQEKALRLKAQQKAAGLASLDTRLKAAVLRYRAEEAERGVAAS